MKASPSVSPEHPPAPPVEPPQGITTPAPASAAPAGPAQWPRWFGAADLSSAAFVLVAALFAGSFAARNSDAWLHLAAGRLIATGQYPWGGDPFSFAAPDRPWVNTSWLYDLGLYAAFRADSVSGGVPVALKALAFAAAFGLGFALRRPGHALWPWVVCTALGVLTAAPYATLRPAVGSMLFLAATVVVLYRGRWATNKWTGPAVLGVLFAVWANVDQWFVLGPLAVALVLVGELLQNKLFAGGVTTADDPYTTAPPVPGLVRALVVGCAACLLNPTLLAGLAKDPGEAIAQLVPADLGWGLPVETADDPDFAPLTYTPLSPGFMERPAFGYNLNGLAALTLFIGGAVALAADFARLRAAHILLWVGFAAVALQQYRLLPFFAVVATPLAAAHLNGLSARARLRGVADPGTRVLLTLSGVGRIVTVPAAAVLAFAGWPGWLHPPAADPAFARRVVWFIDADPGPQRTAQMIARWRENGDLAETAHGLAAGPEHADYCAWLVPAEKTFVDSRYGFHRAELADLIRLRKALGVARAASENVPDSAAVREMIQKYDAGYVILPGVGRAVAANRDEYRERFVLTALSLLERGDWRLWHLDGRAAVLGPSSAAGSDRLRFDPVRLAFGPEVTPVPKGVVVPAPGGKPDPEWYDFAAPVWDQFTARPKPLPPEADDAAVYDNYGKLRQLRLERNWQVESFRRAQLRAAVAGVAAVVPLMGAEPLRPDEPQFAYPLLALRSARRAVAACPDRSEPYRVLAWAYEGSGLPLFQRMPVPVGGPRFGGPDQPPVMGQYSVPGDRPEQIVTALVRALARLPRPADCPPDVAVQGMLWNQQLADLYFRPPPRQLPREQADAYMREQQLDLSREALRSAVEYGKAAKSSPELFRRVIPPGSKVDDPAAAVIEDLEERENRVTALVVPRNDALEQRAAANKPVERFYLAAAFGLPGKAIEVFKDVKDPKEFGDYHLAAAVQLIELELRAGRLEDAAADLDALAEAVGDPARKAGPESQFAADAVRYLRFRVARLAGDYEQAGEGWVDLFAGRLPQLPPEGRAAVLTFQPGAEEAAWALGGVVGRVAYEGWGERAVQANQALVGESLFNLNRAILALQEGNIKEATARFTQAQKPQGVELAAFGNTAGVRESEVYLGLIRKAAEAGTGKK